MKRTRTYLYLLLLLTSVFHTLPFYSQSSQYALYNYRNDGDFDAWLNVDIDSITYSCIDTLGVEHDDIVVQEVWTPYQVYRIPIEAIDSIGFRAPETKYNEKVFFITDDHIPYIINVDDLNITFDKSISNDLLPTMGQILVAETSEDPLEDGFAGRIIDIVNTDDGKIYICEEVALSDIFDRILFISECATDGELEEESSQNVRKARTRWIDIDKTIHIDLDPVEIKPDDEDDDKEKFPITIKYQPDLKMVCFVNVIKNHPAIAKITFKQTHSLYFQAKYEIDKQFTKEWWLGKKDIRIHIPVKAVDAVIKPYIRFGAFVDASAKVKFEYTVPFFNFEHTFGLDYNESRDEDNRVQFINEANLTYEKPTMKLSVDGSLAFGLAVKLGANLIHKKLLNFESTFHIGPKLIGHFDLYSERLAEDANVYRQLKTTTLQLNGYVAMPKATYQYFGSGPKLAKSNTWKGATWSNKVVKEKSFIPNDLFPDGIEFTWYINKWNLLPHFDEPTVKEVTANSAYAYLHPYHNLIFPVDLGVAFKKYSTGDVIEYDYGSYWGEEHNKETKYEHIFEDLEASTTYKVYPTVSLFGLKMDAEPSVDYTVSDKLLVNPNIVTIKKGETAEVTVSGGSGKYSAIDDNPEIAKALLFDYNLGTGEHKAILTISGVDIGETYLTILDTNNASNCILRVNVIDSDVPSLTLSSKSLALSVGKDGSVEITSGTGNYTAESSDTDVATVEVSGSEIKVNALKAGLATITVTDTETTLTANIEVIVSDKESNDIPAEAIDLGLPSGTLWASYNVGATKPEEFGGYYAWGETEEKNEYSAATYKYCDGTEDTCHDMGESICGTNYDVAHVRWGGKWQMPSHSQFEELITNCDQEITTLNGVKGITFTGSNGNSIFLPAAGEHYGTESEGENDYGDYFSGTQYTELSYAYGFYFGYEGWGYEKRWNGHSVRPVYIDDYKQDDEQDNVEIFTVNGVSFKMVKVEGGTFMMGAADDDSDARDDEKPQHQVTLSSFSIGETEVTQELWEAVMGSNPSNFEGAQRPVEKVSWDDCQDFISKLNALTGKQFRLPTEAEWEYAARGGNMSKGYKYSGSNTIEDVVWYEDNSEESTHDVKTKQANELGLYDMSGNVWEWCEDWYGDYSSSSQSDPTGPSTGLNRVNRGGSWRDDARSCRVSLRSLSAPDNRNYDSGLRLAISDFTETKKLKLSESSIDVYVNTKKQVEIQNGSGEYELINDYPDIVEAGIEIYKSGNTRDQNATRTPGVEEVTYSETLWLKGKTVGKAVVTVKDLSSEETATIEVVVKENNSGDIETFTVNGVSFNMVKVEGGTFMMGAADDDSDAWNDEKPQHEVPLSSFSIGETEVTQELWEAVMGSNPSNFEGAQRPVEQVSWDDCQDFITKLNALTGKQFRLPTEAEWEYAARGGNMSKGYKYSGSNTIDDVAWYWANSESSTHDVKTKQANELGLYDMSGNVWEWCQDWYDESYYSSSSQSDPTGPSTGSSRVHRGGSWINDARYCRMSYRADYAPDDRHSNNGLRLAL